MHYLKPISKGRTIIKEEKTKCAFICAHISLVSASYLTEEQNLVCLCTFLWIWHAIYICFNRQTFF